MEEIYVDAVSTRALPVWLFRPESPVVAATLFCYDVPLNLMNIHDTSFVIVFEEIKISIPFKSG